VTISDKDRKAFAAATSDVRRLQPKNVAKLDAPRPKPKARQARAAREEILQQSLNGPLANDFSDEVAFRRELIKLPTFRRLRRGEYALEAELDLHGMRLAEARSELKRFLVECIEQRLACVRIIHGKGSRSGPAGPILKPSVHHWLAQWDQVLAFVSAQPRHGGSGAVYVLLKTH